MVQFNYYFTRGRTDDDGQARTLGKNKLSRSPYEDVK